MYFINKLKIKTLVFKTNSKHEKTILAIALSFIIIIHSVLFAQPIEENVQDNNSTTKTTWINKVENWYEDNMNYGSIVLLMTIESSFIPFPSEVVIPPAAYIASKPESDLNIFLVILFVR